MGEEYLKHWQKFLKNKLYVRGVMSLYQIIGGSGKLGNKKQEKSITQLRMKYY